MVTLEQLAKSAMLGSNDDLLLVSAIRAGITELGGLVPATFEGATNGCGAESRPQMPEQAAGLLERLIAGEFDGLLPEFLQLSAERGYIVPPETLPALLGLGKNDLRKLVIPVIGERGRWLAAHNPAWAYALGRDPLEAWENGLRAERVAALEQVRASEPGKARAWVQASWEQDSPEDRAAFLGTFSTNLGMDDEPWLEACLDDKRKEVREAARGFLIRLEDSRFVRRMWARVRPLIQLKSKFLGGDALEVSLPEGLDAAAKRDGLGGSLLSKKLGEKANWLAQMLASIPPALWSREFGRPPEKLIAAALGCEWKEPLLLGWQLAAQGAADAAWAESLAVVWVTHAEGQNVFDVDSIGTLIMLMRPEKVEALILSSIRPLVGRINDTSMLVTLLKKYRRPWPVKVARIVVQSAQRQSGEVGYYLPQALPGFAHWMPPELAGEFSQGWAVKPKGSWPAKIDEFLLVLNFRLEIRRSLEEK